MSVTYKSAYVVEGQLTKAEVNAGTVVVPPMTNRTITVVDAWVRAIGGAAGANDSVDIVDTTTGTVAVAFARAGLAQNTVLRAGDANTTATNLLAALGEDEGLKIKNTGTDVTTLTHVDYVIKYSITEPYR